MALFDRAGELFDRAGPAAPTDRRGHCTASTRALPRPLGASSLRRRPIAHTDLCTAEAGPRQEFPILHELAHAWDHHTLTPARRDAFLALRRARRRDHGVVTDRPIASPRRDLFVFTPATGDQGGRAVDHRLEPVPEDWQRMLAVVAHPDDLEYGAASAVARWTKAGKWLGYVIVTNGEAGIDGLPPAEAGPIRVAEQEHSAEIVGVDDVRFLGYPDGVVEQRPGLRRDLAREIRRSQPDVLLIATYDLTYGLSPEPRIVNQADHRAVGIATLDAARDAANRWIFPELLDEGFQPWPGVEHVYIMGANEPTHAVDVTDTLAVGVESLQAHRTYLDGLGRDFDPAEFLHGMTIEPGRALGVRNAVALGRVHLHGV